MLFRGNDYINKVIRSASPVIAPRRRQPNSSKYAEIARSRGGGEGWARRSDLTKRRRIYEERKRARGLQNTWEKNNSSSIK